MSNTEFSTFSTIPQKEAILNEVKGMLFEFLMAQKLARRGGCEASFLGSLPTEILSTLNSYETYLRTHDLSLLSALPILAEYLESRLGPRIWEEMEGQKPMSLHLSGKVKSKVAHSEADVLLRFEKGSLALSLKLCKENTLVHNKSAGIQSFFKKYFAFPEIDFIQREFSSCAKDSFEQMQSELALLSGVTLEERRGLGLTLLPGQLPENERAVLHAHYFRLIQKLFEQLQLLHAEDSQLFAQCLPPLLGLSQKNILQAHCYHAGTDTYQPVGYAFISEKDLLPKGARIKLMAPESGRSFLWVEGERFLLQLRIKPMNRFDVESPKVNCSVRYLF